MYVCEKCKTCLHTGGRINCPRGHLGDDRAKKEAARALRCLATGQCNPNTNARKPALKGKGINNVKGSVRIKEDVLSLEGKAFPRQQ
jgi:hypothetical protein